MNNFLAKIQNGVNVVGNAESLINQGFGQEIDSKVTIRFNWVELNESTGKRTDIVCTNFPHKLNEKYEWLIANRRYSGYKTYVYPKKVLNNLTKQIGKKPSNGCRLLYLLDWFKIKDVTVYGYDWKDTPSIVIKDTPCTPENEHHDYVREKDFCLKLIKKNNWVLK